MRVQAPGAGAGMATLIDELKRYRANLQRAGRMLEARAVARCIALIKKHMKD